MKNFTLIFIFFFSMKLQSSAQVNITAAGPTDICNGYVILNVDTPLPGITYDWYVFSFTCTGITQSGPLGSGISFGAGFSGDFYCIATDTGTGGQVASNDIPIRVLPGSMNSTMLPAPYPVNTICFGDTVTLCVPSDLYQTFFTTIAWYRNNTMINGASLETYVTALSGWYKYSIMSPCMTAFSDSVLITNPISPIITGSTTICPGSCTVLTCSPGFASYLWSNGSTAMSIQVCLPGQYTLWVTDFYGCTYTVTVTITASPNLIPVITGDSTICPGQSTILNAIGGTSFLWNTGQVTPTIIANTIGTYTVTVTDNNGCTGSDDITVIAAPPYATVLSTSGPLDICQGDSVQLTEPTAMSSYQWYKNNVIIAGATNPSIWVSASGRYKCLSTDVQNCPAASNQLRVRVVCFPPDPADEKVGEVTGNSKLLHVFPNPSSGVYNLEWNGVADVLLNITVANVVGQVVFDGEFTGKQFRIDLSSFPNGIYVIHATDGNNSENIRLVKTDQNGRMGE